jgi:hypothetical protein
VKIDHVYVAGQKHDLRFTRCCVASIRRWYPDIPISLLKDESRGEYDTRELEEAWSVTIFEGEGPVPTDGWSKLEPLFLSRGTRCLILDSDVVFLGRVLDWLEACDADFVVEALGGPVTSLSRHYFDLDGLKEIDPDFVYPGYHFNTGQFVASTGVLHRDDFEPFVCLGRSPRILRRDVFASGEQGVLNYVLLKKEQIGQASLARLPFMLWGPGLRRRSVRVRELGANSPNMSMVHWAGPKAKLFWRIRNGRLLRHFEASYYSSVPGGRRKRLTRSARLAWAILTRTEHPKTKPPRRP